MTRDSHSSPGWELQGGVVLRRRRRDLPHDGERVPARRRPVGTRRCDGGRHVHSYARTARAGSATARARVRLAVVLAPALEVAPRHHRLVGVLAPSMLAVAVVGALPADLAQIP